MRIGRSRGPAKGGRSGGKDGEQAGGGAGDFLGGAIARRFAREDSHVVATRRRGDLEPLVQAIEGEGQMITAIHSDARDEDAVATLMDGIERDIGPVAVVVFNVGSNVRFGITETTARVYHKVWETFVRWFPGQALASWLAIMTATRSSIWGCPDIAYS